MRTAEIALKLDLTLGEGPRWFADRGELHWVDIGSGRHYRWDGRSATPTEHVHDAGLVGVAPASDGRAVIVSHQQVRLEGPGSGERLLADVPGVEPTHGRANDSRADPRGRLWLGTLVYAPDMTDAELYRIDPEGAVLVRAGLGMANGLGWSPDGTVFYHADTPRHHVTRSEVLPAEGLADPAVLVDAGPDLPDGLAVDAAGGVWVAFWGGGRVERYNPSGERTDVVEVVGAEFVTAVALGDDDRRTLYITTATGGEPGHGAHAGSLFRVRVEIPGQIENAVNVVDTGVEQS